MTGTSASGSGAPSAAAAPAPADPAAPAPADPAAPARGAPIAAGRDDLAAVVYNADGLAPAIIQDAATKAVLMMAWMSAETLSLTLAEGRTVFWSRSRQVVWRKGETSGERQWVREAYYDCDADALLFIVDQQGGGACHTGEYSCFFRRFGD